MSQSGGVLAIVLAELLRNHAARRNKTCLNKTVNK
jgi:hypothetical protein